MIVIDYVREWPVIETFGSCFSGIGGADLGFCRAGLRCVWQVEIDGWSRRVLAKYWPDVRRHDDIRTFPPAGAEDWRCDVVVGGFPCQETSVGAAVHGGRAGLAGANSGLWFEMLRVVRLVRPRWVVVENVAGAESYRDEIEGGLAAAGYRLPWGVFRVSAAAVGAPHLRRRLFWAAYRDEAGLAVPRPAGPPAAVGDARGTPAGNPWWDDFPRTLRVHDRPPAGVDRRRRIAACGNAVVPAVAEAVARWVIETDRTTHNETTNGPAGKARTGDRRR